MITGAVKNKVDQIWTNIWAGGITNPLTVIEQLTYLMFIRSLDVKETRNEKMEVLTGMKVPHIFPSSPVGQAMRWSHFKNKDADEIFHIVSTFVFPAIKNMRYGQLPDFDGSGKMIPIADRNGDEDSPDTAFSRFLEMFGNKEYSICQLSDQCEIITKGTTPTTIGYNFTTDGVRFIKIENITEEGKFDTAKMMHISDECNMIMRRSQLKSGDLLFSIAGAIGRCAVVTNDILPADINQALAIIRLRKDAQLSRNFLFAVLKSSYVEKQYKGLRRGGAQLNLSLKDIGNFKILLPPESEQENFIDLYKQVDKSKYRGTISLHLLEDVSHML